MRWVEWDEPHSDKGGNDYLPIVCRAKVEDVIKFQRRREPRYETDEDALDDFVVVYWARIVEE